MARDQGSASACEALFNVYSEALLGANASDAEAQKALVLGAERGNHSCRFALALAYQFGSRGTQVDFGKAKKLYLDMDYPTYAADLLESGGPNLPKDEAAGFALRLKYAETHEYDTSQTCEVAKRYEEGVKGAPKDWAQALKWWRVAKQRGSADADAAIKRLGGSP